MSDWTVLCVRRDATGAISHIGVDVPRGTQHVPLEEAFAVMAEGRHRFFVDRDGDRLLLRQEAFALVTTAGPILDTLPDCGTAARFGP